MAGAIPGFPAAAVRENLRIPMRLGMPVDPAQWPEFVRVPAPAASAGVDANGYAWDPEAQPAPAAEERVRVLCAMESDAPGERIENFGTRQPDVLVITLLDEEYRQIEGFTYVNIFPTLGGPPVRYHYRKVRLRTALDTVEVWQIEVSTEDVS
jgi:hypothetical protein